MREKWLMIGFAVALIGVFPSTCQSGEFQIYGRDMSVYATANDWVIQFKTGANAKAHGNNSKHSAPTHFIVIPADDLIYLQQVDQDAGVAFFIIKYQATQEISPSPLP